MNGKGSYITINNVQLNIKMKIEIKKILFSHDQIFILLDYILLKIESYFQKV